MTDQPQPRSLDPDEKRALQKKLDEISHNIETLTVAVDEIRGMLTPCYGIKDGESCIRPDRHRGRHLSAAGTEWVDD